jgi:hypothetical protein
MSVVVARSFEYLRRGFKPGARHSQTSRRGSSGLAMKKRSLSIGGRPGPLSHATQSQFSRAVSIPGFVTFSSKNLLMFMLFRQLSGASILLGLSASFACEFRI